MNLVEMVRDYMRISGVGANIPNKIDWVGKMRQVLSTAMGKGLDYATTLPADADKDCNYSWHVHVIFTKLVYIVYHERHHLLDGERVVSMQCKYMEMVYIL